MGWVFRQPGLADAELERRARIAMSVLRGLVVAIGLVISLSLLAPSNDPKLTFALYTPLVGLLFVGAALLHRGRVALVGWGISLMVWATISLVLIWFGGLSGHNAMAFVIAMTIAGIIVNGRAAGVIALLSLGSSVLAWWLETTGRLPVPLVPLSLLNSLISVSVSMLLGGWLISLWLSSLERARAREREAAAARDQAHASALRAQKLESVGRLAAGVAHDLNNVLSVVTLTADELKRVSVSEPALGPLVDDLRHAADKATLLSKRMVAMSRAGGSPPETLEIGDVAEQFVPLLRRLLPEGSRLELTRRSTLQVSASRSALEHVLLNLVLNARDAMASGGTIEVIVDARGFTVKDTGCGMPPEVKAKLFTPFFTTREKGTGLGLANVAELVDSMRARVEVESQVGQGSAFTVVFPTS